MARPRRNTAEKFETLSDLLTKAERKPKEAQQELKINGLPEGRWIARGVYRMEREFRYGEPYGRWPLESPCESGNFLRPWGGDPSPVFIDTETTGLSGGTGTYAFLVGLGLCGQESLRVIQLFLAGPGWERSWLDALEAELPESYGLVTYNGRAFDLPLLRTRYILARAVPSWNGAPHMDLLSISRSFYKGRLASCSLSSIEKNVLGLHRSGVDVPGRLIPQVYAQYLRTHDASPLRGIFYHNALDIVSLAAFQVHAAEMLNGKCSCAADMVRAGDLWAAKGDGRRAREVWQRALGFNRGREAALLRLADAEKDVGNYEAAHRFYEESLETERRPVRTLETMAKIEEHKFHRCADALEHASEALRWLESRRIFRDRRWDEERHSLLHRIERLKRKLAAQEGRNGPPSADVV